MNYDRKNAKLSTDYPESNLKRDMTQNEECRRTSDTDELKCFCILKLNNDKNNLLSTKIIGMQPYIINIIIPKQ